MKKKKKKKLAPQIARGTGMGIVGIVLAAITKGTIFDVTGESHIRTRVFICRSIGSLSKIKKNLWIHLKKINKGRNELESEVQSKLNDTSSRFVKK